MMIIMQDLIHMLVCNMKLMNLHYRYLSLSVLILDKLVPYQDLLLVRSQGIFVNLYNF